MSADRPAPYATPTAFRRALTDRLRPIAAPAGPWPLSDLQRQFAYDRLLVRLYLLDDAWILKGATALLARRIAVRHTVDIDVYRDTTRAAAERDLRVALDVDAGDWFRFEAGASRPVADGVNGVRIPIAARLGTTLWTSFHIDLVAEGVGMTGAPDRVPALTVLSLPGLEQPGYGRTRSWTTSRTRCGPSWSARPRGAARRLGSRISSTWWPSSQRTGRCAGSALCPGL